ncbi:hypothetical protein DRE_04489 [Drechslerella stenobrocha 248]|uniref:Extracellular membrane protein CFEM domain-containing protein n=1 Tax=Drechslerella stenobrocha 248 TaxID=1043628 RepID=W7I219_9PEZI|nr:hypothetical protein DRE_04489 [Drechslerella stenobrocha 248]
MSLLRPPKPPRLLSSYTPLLLLLATFRFSRPATAQITGLFPEYLRDCIDRCQPLLLANSGCTLLGQTSQDCLCRSPYVEQFYNGDTCTCTSTFESTEFRNWFQGTGACSVYVEERLQASSESSTASSTAPPTSSTSSTDSETTSSSSTSTRRETTTRTLTSTSAETDATSRATTATTLATVTSPSGTEAGGPTSSTTSGNPSLATNSQQDSGFITEQNRRWVIPVITVGALVVAGALVFAALYFFCGCCRRNGRGRYTPANNPGVAGAAGASGSTLGALGVKGRRRRKNRMWLSTVPFFGVGKSSASQSSDSSSLVDDHEGMVDTSYYGAGGSAEAGAGGRIPATIWA